MEVVLSCIKLGAQVWRARPVVLFSSSLQEVFPILSSFILLSRNDPSLLLVFYIQKYIFKLSPLCIYSITAFLEKHSIYWQFHK